MVGLRFHMRMEIRREQDDFNFQPTHSTTGQTPTTEGIPQAEKYKMVGELVLPNLVRESYKFQLYVVYHFCEYANLSEVPSCSVWKNPGMESQWTFRDNMRFSVIDG